MWIKTKDGSVVDQQGKVIHFSLERFINDICIGNCCFICGTKPSEKQFNDEHVLPAWILSRYNLFAKTITLPNGTTIRYDRYTVPCCIDCNSLMGRIIEEPISQATGSNQESLSEFLNDHSQKAFVWMALIFLKTHLKDRTLRLNQDRRQGSKKIADQYDWSDLHHIHCVVRSFYNNCALTKEATGSFLCIPVGAQASKENFDFGDLYLAQTIMIRLGDIAFLAVLDDSCGAMSYFWQKLEHISGPVSELQLREIMAELAYLNIHLKDRPVFQTQFDFSNEASQIIVKRPELSLKDLDKKIRGKLLRNAIKHALPHIQIPGKSHEEFLEALDSGNLSFLFDDHGKFIEKSWTPASNL